MQRMANYAFLKSFLGRTCGKHQILVYEMGTVKQVILGTFMVHLCYLISCIGQARENHKDLVPAPVPVQHTLIDTAGKTICDRFNPPPGFSRTAIDSSSFGFFLRHLELKRFGTWVLYYDGRAKHNDNVYISVIDMDIGNRDLQQCADAVMRLRSEFLYARQRYGDIHFNFISDGKPRYYEDFVNGDHSYQRFREYLDYIFAYANTRSLQQELMAVGSIFEISIGDVFIQAGNPFGHAVIVVDMAENTDTGEKVYMLAQSFMPAQEIQVLVNPNNAGISPWYLPVQGPVETPEWTFMPADLRRFSD